MPKSVFNRLRVGDRLKFAVGKNNKGFLAEYIEPEAEASPSLEEEGVIDTIDTGYMWGFIRDSEGHRVFFHRSELEEPKHMSWLEAGAPVAFKSGQSTKGPIALSIRRIYTTLLKDALQSGERIKGKVVQARLATKEKESRRG